LNKSYVNHAWNFTYQCRSIKDINLIALLILKRLYRTRSYVQFQARMINLNRLRYKKCQSFISFFLVIVTDSIIQLKVAVISFAGFIDVLFIGR